MAPRCRFPAVYHHLHPVASRCHRLLGRQQPPRAWILQSPGDPNSDPSRPGPLHLPSLLPSLLNVLLITINPWISLPIEHTLGLREL